MFLLRRAGERLIIIMVLITVVVIMMIIIIIIVILLILTYVARISPEDHQNFTGTSREFQPSHQIWAESMEVVCFVRRLFFVSGWNAPCGALEAGAPSIAGCLSLQRLVMDLPLIHPVWDSNPRTPASEPILLPTELEEPLIKIARLTQVLHK